MGTAAQAQSIFAQGNAATFVNTSDALTGSGVYVDGNGAANYASSIVIDPSAGNPV